MHENTLNEMKSMYEKMLKTGQEGKRKEIEELENVIKILRKEIEDSKTEGKDKYNILEKDLKRV